MFTRRIGTALGCAFALAAAGSGPAALAQETPAASAPAPNDAGQAEAGMADFFKGLVTITLPAFKSYHVSRQFFPDHTFADVERGKVTRGTWSVEDGRICTQRPSSPRYCNQGLGRTLGESWQDKDPYTGNEVDFALAAERKPLR